jgi:hypothetical protein
MRGEPGQGGEPPSAKRAELGHLAEQGGKHGGPMPGTEASSRARPARLGLFSMRAAITRSSFSILRSRRAIMLSMSRRISLWPALWRPTFSALRASTRCLRRRRKSASRTRSGSGGVVASRGRRLPISARMRASTRAVLARMPVARANARACRGLTRAKAIPRPASASISGPSQPLVASNTTRAAGSMPAIQTAIPDGVFSILDLAPPGRAWMSSQARERSQPMTIGGMVKLLSMSCGLVAGPSNCSGPRRSGGGPCSHTGSGPRGGDGLPSAASECHEFNRQGVVIHRLAGRSGVDHGAAAGVL